MNAIPKAISCFVFLAVLTSVSARDSRADAGPEFRKLELRHVSGKTRGHFSLFYGSHSPVEYEVVGLSENPNYGKSRGELSEQGYSGAEIEAINRHQKYFKHPLGVRIELELWEAGLTGNFVLGRIEDVISIGQMNGRPLRDLCGKYSGASVGVVALGGTTAYRISNKKGAVLRSNTVEAYGVGINLSYVGGTARCFDSDSNPNWNRVVRVR